MKLTSLRVAAFVATLAILFPAAGCIRFSEDLVVFADASGKMTLTVGISEEFIEKMKAMGANADDFEKNSGLDPEDLDNAEGVVAFSKPTHEKKDGWRTTVFIAYFDDINKVKIWEKNGEEKRQKLSFSFKKDGEGHVLEIEDKMMSNDDAEKMETMPDEQKAQFWEQAKGMMKGFKISSTVKMPGAVSAADGYKTKAGRTASIEVTEEAIKNIDDLGKSMKSIKRKVTCGKNEASDGDLAAFKKELADAKAAWPKIKEELIAEAAAKKKKKDE
jgi:hypothetical protein